MSTIAVKKVKLGDNADASKNFLIEVPAVADGTLTIKRENGTAVLSIAANGKAVIPGVVGTVAQVGGIPTGQVVERGSNANGEYVRFADGTQICWLRTLLLSHTANVDLLSSWTFPSAFPVGQEPKTDVSLRAAITTNSHTVAKLSSNSTPTAAILRTQFSVTQHYALGLFAVGRWF